MRLRLAPPLLVLLALAGCGGGSVGGSPNGPHGDDDDFDGWSGTAEPGALIEDGLVVDVTPTGIDAMERMVEDMGAIGVPMDPITEPLGTLDNCEWSVQISGLEVLADVHALSIEPISHGIDLDATTSISVNSAAAPFDLFLDAEGGLFDSCNLLDMHCDVWVDPMDVSLALEMWLDIHHPADGSPSYLDAIVATPEHDLDTAFTGDKVQLGGCLIATVDDILGFFGTDLVSALIDEQIGDLFASVETEIPALVEEAVEDGFDQAVVEETLDLAGAELDLFVQPRDLMLEPEGIRVALDLALDAPQAACVAGYDPGGFYLEESPLPPQDSTADYHVGAYVADDVVRSGLYHAWRGGVLCYAVDPAELGFPLDTSFLSLMLDEDDRHVMDRIWLGEPQPMAIVTRPRIEPELVYDGDHDLELLAPDMGLGFHAMTQDRMARIFTVDVDVGAGVDVTALGDGSFTLDVALDTDHLDPRLYDSEFVEPYAEQIEANFGEIVLGVLDTAVESLLGDLQVGPVAIGGVGLTSLTLGAAGHDGEYLGALVDAAVVDPTASCATGCGGGEDAGCGGDEGCVGGEGSCDEGSCSLARRPAAPAWKVNVALVSACLAVVCWHRRRNAR